MPPIFAGRPVAILAGGPSLTEGQLDLVRLARREAHLAVIAINDSWRLMPDAELLWFCDARWWRWHGAAVSMGFTGAVWTLDNLEIPGVRHIQNAGAFGFAPNPAQLMAGRNAGYQSLHLAAHAGARLALLLGYDMRDVDGRSHWHAGHPVAAPPDRYAQMLEAFPHLVGPLAERRLEVVNCTPDSALDCFPRVPLASAVARLTGRPVICARSA